MPPSNAEAMVHYQDTLLGSVRQERIQRYLTSDENERLHRLFGERPVKVWGSRNSSKNRSGFDRMKPGDDLLVVKGDVIEFMGKVALKTVNSTLSRELWKNLKDSSEEGWDLIYFVVNPIQLNIPFESFCDLIGYEPNYQPQGFTAVADAKVQRFYERYDDLYSILLKVKEGQPVLERDPTPARRGFDQDLIEVSRDDIDEVIKSEIVSDHVRMQWKLASLGRKAGAKVWIPASDQSRLKRIYQFNEFEPEFAGGLDLPKSYVENIDVVWKEDFRIHAAFEVENTTAIYSGLLRFADLTVLAPNTTYPLVVVAPSARRGRVLDQLLRPSFKRLALRDKVGFLPYETVDDMHDRFKDIDRGISVEVILDKTEKLAA
jgi:hypothetical protein